MKSFRQSCDDPAISALKMEAPGLKDTEQLPQGRATGRSRITVNGENKMKGGVYSHLLYFLRAGGTTSRMLN